MTVADWLTSAIADAERRGLGELTQLLEGLARSTTALRRADEAARGVASPPAPEKTT